jgi:hypothetical protein
MIREIILPVLGAVAAIALTAAGALAQQHLAVTNRAPRVVATYDFGARRFGMALPMSVVIADSAGTLVASARLEGEPASRPLSVTVIESDLVLQGETPDGLLTLVLEQQAAGTNPAGADGRWSLGKAEGRLRTVAR